MAIRTVPILPCPDIDEVARFYGALGFETTYRQVRPNPYLALRRGEVDLHFGGIDGFDPATSYASVILVVPDTGVIFDQFAAGLRREFGRLPISGIPRITRPRRKQGTSYGFTVVDPGGNWIRIAVADDDPSDDETEAGSLERVLRSAARQADAHGDERRAISVLEAGLTRYPEAPAVDQVPVRAYLVELLVRIGDNASARAQYATLIALDLSFSDRDRLAEHLESAREALEGSI